MCARAPLVPPRRFASTACSGTGSLESGHAPASELVDPPCMPRTAVPHVGVAADGPPTARCVPSSEAGASHRSAQSAGLWAE